ncbi:MAG: TRAP transporter substrate-binding protein DctP [Thiothrix sp.]|nr:TRAP transporter substrate-binding protein DctP [Thiothrix sp.]HPE62191.1 TRAP transporter substrate-binding protein DctP [Thiolinea sp.]
MTHKSRSIISLVVISLTGLFFTTPVQAKTRLLVNCFLPPQHFLCREVLPEWKKSVEAATEKRVVINIPAKSMSPPPAQLESVLNGVFDGALQFNGFITEQVVGPRISMTPFTAVADSEVMSMALWRTYEKFMADKNEYQGVQLLGLFAAPGADFFSTTNTPITTLDDLKSRKMWALPGAPAELLKTLGTPVVSTPAVGMNEIISHGVVDGHVGAPSNEVVAFNVLPYSKSVTRTRQKIFSPGFSFFVSDAKWKAISPQDQQAILAVSGEAFSRMAGATWWKHEQEALKKIDEKIQVLEADPAFEAEMIKASQPFIDAWIKQAEAKGIDGKTALQFYQDTINELVQ